MSGTRPVNHPQRRLAALATLAREWSRFQRTLGKAIAGDPPSPSFGVARTPATTAQGFFSELDHPFWKFHYTLTSEAASKKMALIGESRVAEILANVLFPFWISQDAAVWPAYARLPARLSNRRLETAATRLFGNEPRRKQFLKTVAHQQGLLQIYEDFCMQDNSDCAQCPFPEQMAKWA